MDRPWFSFSFNDFALAFLSVLLEGTPFILLGTLLSGLIDQFLPARAMLRLLPRNPFLGICVSGALGLIFPMCECGVVPVIRRLIGKGLPLSNAIAYMLAAPILNPVVAVSTYAAFRGSNALDVTILRLGLGYFVAVVVALVVHKIPVGEVLRPGVISTAAPSESGGPSGRLVTRLALALRVATSDFLDVMVYFIFGVAISAVFSTAVNREVIDPLAQNIWLATFAMMALAVLLALCSTSDAFIAANMPTFGFAPKLAFLVFGPMMDFKLLFMYSAVFKRRIVLVMLVGLMTVIGLLSGPWAALIERLATVPTP